MSDESLRLSDGRSIGFRCLGDSRGEPLFFFHGTPGSRLVFAETDAIAQLPGYRLIVPERPGYGISDPHPGRVLLDWAGDIAELADAMGFHKFAVAGVSGGGPHALACGYRLADRVTMVLVLSSPSPCNFRGVTRGMSVANRLGLILGRYAPGLVGRMIRANVDAFAKDPEGFVNAITGQMAPSDRELLAGGPCREGLMRDLREAYRQGGEAHARDAALAMTSGDWGFDLRKIAVPVHLWHGEEDTLVSMQMARHLASEIPGCTAHFVPGAGHLLTEHAVVVDEVRAVLSQRVQIERYF